MKEERLVVPENICAIINGRLYRRYRVEMINDQYVVTPTPVDFKYDTETFDTYLIPFYFWFSFRICNDAPSFKYFLEAQKVGTDYYGNDLVDGFYELCETKDQLNHLLMPLGEEIDYCYGEEKYEDVRQYKLFFEEAQNNLKDVDNDTIYFIMAVSRN